MSPEIADKIHQSFTAQTMMASLGARLDEVSHGIVRLSAPILPGFCQQQGFGHAALTFALGDTAAGFAALSIMPPDCEVLTSEIKINLLAPASGSRLSARGRVIKPGRRIVVVQADVYASDDLGQERHIALLQGSMVPVAV